MDQNLKRPKFFVGLNQIYFEIQSKPKLYIHIQFYK